MKHTGSGSHTARAKLGRLGVGALSIVFALSQVLGLLGTAVPSAWAEAAAEPETVTVTLAAGEHGSLAIAGEAAESDTVTVDKGSNVTVEVTPDDGWFADSLTAFAGDGSEAAKLEVEDGRATFKAETDTTVTCAFYENGSNGSAALEAVATDASAKQAKQASDKAYIKANLDESLSGLDKFERRDVLTVTTTTVDSGKVASPTLDGLWADTDGDGMGDYSDALKSNAVSHAVLYDLDDSSDYLVGRAGSDISGATLADWGASENNADAAMRRGLKFDAATGLVYVPKKYTVKNKAGEYKVASSRIQLLYATPDKGAANTFPVRVEAENVDGRAAKSGTASVDVSSPDTQIELARDKAAPGWRPSPPKPSPATCGTSECGSSSPRPGPACPSTPPATTGTPAPPPAPPCRRSRTRPADATRPRRSTRRSARRTSTSLPSSPEPGRSSAPARSPRRRSPASPSPARRAWTSPADMSA